MTNRVDYEWVVETIHDDEIEDVSHFDDDRLAAALVYRADLLAEGKTVDFGLCRHVVEGHGESEDEVSRSYAYCDDAGVVPSTTDDGSHIPARLRGLSPLWAA